jgi:hypothetical protein
VQDGLRGLSEFFTCINFRKNLCERGCETHSGGIHVQFIPQRPEHSASFSAYITLGRQTMRIIFSLLYAFVAVVAGLSGVQAAPINKCVIDGSVTYQQGPCPSTQARKDPTLEELNAAERTRRAAATSSAVATPKVMSPAPTAVHSSFRCDGRKYCTQMSSCAEARHFLANCPGVKMDGDNDGIPCEEQWCRP